MKLFPEQASTVASEIDLLLFILLGVSAFFILAIGSATLFFVIRYRRTRENPVGRPVGGALKVEIAWTVIPLVIGVALFALGALPYLKVKTIPDNAMEIAVVGKQWMWKFQHPNGRSEINDLHIPVGRPIHLRMISQDVIHSVYIPAFRIKQDALPMYYTSIWFEATKVGKYRLFCTEYCGKDHSIMGGWVYVMHPHDYEEWVQQAPVVPLKKSEALAQTVATGPSEQPGAELFVSKNCIGCHQNQNMGAGPSLYGLWGSQVELANGKRVLADNNYIRESILNPEAKIKKGYSGLMPSYRGRVSEEEINLLIKYIRSLEKRS